MIYALLDMAVFFKLLEKLKRSAKQIYKLICNT